VPDANTSSGLPRSADSSSVDGSAEFAAEVSGAELVSIFDEGYAPPEGDDVLGGPDGMQL
jgi:hypothetical protein